MSTINENVILHTITEITHALESRITFLMNDFTSIESEVTQLMFDNGIKEFDEIKNEELRNKLNRLVEIFVELRPIERLIRFKYKEFNQIFDKLVIIEAERIHGKFFSFLMCLPNIRRPYTKKTNIFIERSLPGQATIK